MPIMHTILPTMPTIYAYYAYYACYYAYYADYDNNNDNNNDNNYKMVFLRFYEFSCQFQRRRSLARRGCPAHRAAAPHLASRRRALVQAGAV